MLCIGAAPCEKKKKEKRKNRHLTSNGARIYSLLLAGTSDELVPRAKVRQRSPARSNNWLRRTSQR
jgi:hypothetical protein